MTTTEPVQPGTVLWTPPAEVADACATLDRGEVRGRAVMVP